MNIHRELEIYRLLAIHADRAFVEQRVVQDAEGRNGKEPAPSCCVIAASQISSALSALAQKKANELAAAYESRNENKQEAKP
jgi:hypothetical protein